MLLWANTWSRAISVRIPRLGLYLSQWSSCVWPAQQQYPQGTICQIWWSYLVFLVCQHCFKSFSPLWNGVVWQFWACWRRTKAMLLWSQPAIHFPCRNFKLTKLSEPRVKNESRPLPAVHFWKTADRDHSPEINSWIKDPLDQHHNYNHSNRREMWPSVPNPRGLNRIRD